MPWQFCTLLMSNWGGVAETPSSKEARCGLTFPASDLPLPYPCLSLPPPSLPRCRAGPAHLHFTPSLPRRPLQILLLKLFLDSEEKTNSVPALISRFWFWTEASTFFYANPVKRRVQQKGESMVFYPKKIYPFFLSEMRPLTGETNFTLGSHPKFFLVPWYWLSFSQGSGPKGYLQSFPNGCRYNKGTPGQV